MAPLYACFPSVDSTLGTSAILANAAFQSCTAYLALSPLGKWCSHSAKELRRESCERLTRDTAVILLLLLPCCTGKA